MSSLKLVTFGEVMMRLTPENFRKFNQVNHLQITFGGGEANVSVGVAALGMEAEHVSIFPANELGDAALSYLRSNNVVTQNIKRQPGRLGLYFLQMGAAARPSKVIYDRAGSAFCDLSPSDFDWNVILAGKTWFHYTGITPGIGRVQAEVLLEAITTAKKFGMTVSADINYRKNLWKYGDSVSVWMQRLLAYTDIVMGSKNDIKEALDLIVEGEDDKYLPVCKQLLNRFPHIRLCVNTKRESVSASHNELFAMGYDGAQYAETSKVQLNPIIDRIGGGDAFMAGLIYGMQHHDQLNVWLRYGLASAVLKHSQPGDAPLANTEDLELIFSGDHSGKLVR